MKLVFAEIITRYSSQTEKGQARVHLNAFYKMKFN